MSFRGKRGTNDEKSQFLILGLSNKQGNKEIRYIINSSIPIAIGTSITHIHEKMD